jgi:hypothetical protein
MKDYSKENLDVVTYRNGDPIPFVKSEKKWAALKTGAYCYYDNDPEKGVLYNWYAVNDPRGLAPEGWKIPTIKELEQIDLTTGLPGGYRFFNGNYLYIGNFGNWWSSTENFTTNAWSRNLPNGNGYAYSSYNYKEDGFSVRCLRDIKETSFKVERHVMFFAKTEIVTLERLKEFFTQEAIDSFIKYKYLKQI